MTTTPFPETTGPSRAVSRTSRQNRVVLGLLASPVCRLLDRSVVGLRLQGVVTGRMHELPVMFARDEAGLVLYAGRPESKRWWRNLRKPSPVLVLSGRAWRLARAEILRPGTPARETARLTYERRWPRVKVGPNDPLVRVRTNVTTPTARGHRD
jgi:hypothetical protein